MPRGAAERTSLVRNLLQKLGMAKNLDIEAITPREQEKLIENAQKILRIKDDKDK